VANAQTWQETCYNLKESLIIHQYITIKQREFDAMRLPTNQLIDKIETLSNGLTPEQLSKFLDIIDAMTALVEEAGELKEQSGNSPVSATVTANVH
jgi:hypothetical protein